MTIKLSETHMYDSRLFYKILSASSVDYSMVRMDDFELFINYYSMLSMCGCCCVCCSGP